MKITYLHQYFKFPDEPGGTRSYDLAKAFVNKAYRVEVVSSTSNVELKSKKRWLTVEKDGILVHYIYLTYDNKLSYIKRIIVFFRFLWFASFKLLSLKTDLVLATSTPLTIGIPALIKKWKHKTPFVFEARDVWPEAVIAIGAIKNKLIQKLLYWLEKTIYKNARAIVTLSVDMKKSIVSRYPKLNDKAVVVIENISEIKRFQNDFDKNRSLLKEKIGFKPGFSILYAGTFGKVNGIDYVIDLASKTIKFEPLVVFILLGKGAEKDNIIQLAKDKKLLNKNVFILDPVAKKDLPQFYYEVDMGSSFVIDIKELWANSANKFFDTLAAGKPILINHKGWQKEVIAKENIGYVLPAKLNESDVAGFLDYTKDEKTQHLQRENALRVAKQYYSLDVAVKKYCNIFDDIKNACKSN